MRGAAACRTPRRVAKERSHDESTPGCRKSVGDFGGGDLAILEGGRANRSSEYTRWHRAGRPQTGVVDGSFGYLSLNHGYTTAVRLRNVLLSGVRFADANVDASLAGMGWNLPALTSWGNGQLTGASRRRGA